MPQVNYDRDVRPFDDDPGTFSDQDIADQLNAQTFAPITLGNGRDIVAENGWWNKEQDGSWTGAFQDIIDGAAPAAVKSFLAKAWKVLYDYGGSDLATTLRYKRNGEIGTQYSDQWASFFVWAAANVPQSFTADSVEGFYAPGGGLKYPTQDVSAADVLAARDASVASGQLTQTRSLLNEEYNRLYNTYVSPVLADQNPANLTDAAMKQALNSMVANWVDQL